MVRERGGAVAPRKYAVLLWILLGLFALRVTGQILVMLWEPGWLPPPRQWFSGVIPYPYLLGFQLIFLFLMTSMVLGLHPGRGLFGPPGRRFSRFCIAFSVPYYGFMVYRWVFRVLLNPDRRWYDTMIPIVFHCVLATFLVVYGRGGLAADRRRRKS